VTPHKLQPHIHVIVHPFCGSKGKSNNIRGIFRISLFPHHPKMQSQTFYPLREVPTRGGNFDFVDSPLTSTEI
jgi:hypothetical protein